MHFYTLSHESEEAIQVHVEAHSESVNSFINRAISETMERDKDALGAENG